MSENQSQANPNDPSSFLSPPNVLVKIVNTGRADLNGQLGTILSYNAERNRYTLSMTLPSSPHRTPTALSFKPDNLVKASFVEQLQFRAGNARRQMQDISNDPQVREAMRRAYTSIQARLPPGVKPEYLLYALLFALILLVRYIGFSKTILFMSLLTTPIVVAAPDLQSGVELPVVVRNFPRRLKENVVTITGWTSVSERMALGGFIIFMVLSGMVLVTPNRSGKRATASIAAAGGGSDGGVTPPSAVLESPSSLSIESIYKLGFEDATDGKDFGASLADIDMGADVGKGTGPRGIDPNSADDIDWAYNTPPPPPQSSSSMGKFGIGKMMSMFAIFRTLKDLAQGPDGRVSVENLTMNLGRLEPW
eukprot:CAMPEP_0172491508 /NCGR_PEP_ID=MMETSP1066-20121228/22357_1 /TAXON_ID=671091 /ORGANISM="Coscinodiscus wailesii, Strain CCMP2513" /LENGTH=364 /DNA_ID=CAMNT_0013260595 /DNA_START=150 /DNA_END=1241 /DNA_ORIENTATION=-